jgi:sugar O-acyltransferase (sialic acid O-acetyltransferase NeuD family)
VYGASGHAKVVIDIVERQGLYEVAFLIDDDPVLRGKDFFGHRVLGGREALLPQRGRISKAIVAIGSNRARMAVATWLRTNGFSLATAVHPSAQLARGVVVGDGTVIMAGAVVNPDSRFGDNVIVNTQASVDHDCVVGDGAHLAPGSTLCGSVVVGHCTFVCAGATVIPNLRVGSNAVVGAGAVVVRDVADDTLVAGVPAQILRRL